MSKMNKERVYPLLSILLLFVVAPLLAALISPWIYQGLQAVAPADSVLDAPFHRVTSRVVLVMVLVLLYPACRFGGFRRREDIGLVRDPRAGRLAGFGFLIGAVSMLAIYLPAVAMGVFRWDVAGVPLAKHLLKPLAITAGALFVGVFEEILFRGFIFGALRKSLGLAAGVLIGSLFFSIVHFMRPLDPEVVNAWNSGFMLFERLFARAGDAFLQEALTLFGMGVVLSMLFVWTRSLYLVIGLHAGWVWVMMLFRHFVQNTVTLPWLYGSNEWVSKAWIGPIAAVIFLAAAWLTRAYWGNRAVSATSPPS